MHKNIQRATWAMILSFISSTASGAVVVRSSILHSSGERSLAGVQVVRVPTAQEMAIANAKAALSEKALSSPSGIAAVFGGSASNVPALSKASAHSSLLAAAMQSPTSNSWKNAFAGVVSTTPTAQSSSGASPPSSQATLLPEPNAMVTWSVVSLVACWIVKRRTSV